MSVHQTYTLMGACFSCTTRGSDEQSNSAVNASLGVHNDMEILKSLGKGGEGETVLARDEQSGELFALKCIARSSKLNTNHIASEIRVQSNLHHPNIVALHEVVLSPQHLMLKLQYVPGVTLAEYIKSWQNNPKSQRPSESSVRFIFRQLLSALKYCHANSVAHRDVKLSNILINNTVTGRPPHVMLCDFGLCLDTAGDLSTHAAFSTVGTRQYMPIEMLENHVLRRKAPYSPAKMDVWALGVVLYAMLAGRLPFLTPKVAQERKFQMMLDTVRHVHYALCTEEHKCMFARTTISADCLDLLKGMLAIDAKERLSLRQIEEHPWTQGRLSSEHGRYLASLDRQAASMVGDAPHLFINSDAHTDIERIVAAAKGSAAPARSPQAKRANVPLEIAHTTSSSSVESNSPMYSKMLRWIPPQKPCPVIQQSSSGERAFCAHQGSIRSKGSSTSIRDESFGWSTALRTQHGVHMASSTVPPVVPVTVVAGLSASKHASQILATPC